MGKLILFLFLVLALNSSKALCQLHLNQTVDSVDRKLQFSVLPQIFYSKPLGYFCKKEVQLQKAIRLPLFIRVGNKDYVDLLERKNPVAQRNLGLRH